MARAGNGRKTVRFTSVVERSGRPHVHTLWVAPEKDPELQRALAAHRVMTLERSAGGKSEHGVIGFDPRQHTHPQLLIFPKSLKSFEGARVVGVKFDLIEQPDIVAARGETESRRPSREKPKHPERRRATPSSEPLEETSEETTPRREETSREPGERAHEEIPRATPSRVPVHAPRRKRSAARTSRRPTEPCDPALVREVRAALRELKEGKAILAYQRLERAIAD